MPKIARIETFQVPPRWLFVRVETEDGAVGWGEASLEGHAEAVEGAFAALRDRFVGADPARIEEVRARIPALRHRRLIPVPEIAR